LGCARRLSRVIHLRRVLALLEAHRGMRVPREERKLMFRRFKSRINTILNRCGFAPLFTLLLGCDGCQPVPAPPDANTQSAQSATQFSAQSSATSTTGAPVATCETACDNQRHLGCEIGQPTPEGASCVEVCGNLESGPIVSIRWDIECLTGAESCD